MTSSFVDSVEFKHIKNKQSAMRGKMCQRMSWILTTISKVEKEKLGAWLRWMVLPNIMVRALFCFFLFVQHFWAILIKFPSAKSHSYLNSSLQRNSRRSKERNLSIQLHDLGRRISFFLKPQLSLMLINIEKI